MQQILLKAQSLIKRDRSLLIAALIIPIVHLGLGYIGLSMTFVNGASALWPSLGVFLAAMLLVGYRIWPILFLSDFVVSYILYFQNNLLISSIIPAVNLLTPLIGTFLIHRWIKRHNFLTRSRDVLKFIIISIVSPALSSLLAALTLCVSGIAPWIAFSDVFRTWLASDATGILVVTPLLLAWLQKSTSHQKFNRQQLIELVFVLLSLIVITQIAFSGGYPIEYMVIPPLIWSAVRFEVRSSTLLVLVVSAIAVFGTVHGFGSFAQRSSPNESLILLQSFICVIAITSFILCAVTNENRTAETKLRQANDELERRVEERTTELKAAKNQAEVANQAKSEFLANMSHELRTPLNGILGYTQILQQTEALSDKGRKGVDVIHQCGSHLLTLINDVLDLSKIEARKMELRPVDFHFPSFLQGVGEICRIKAEQKVIGFNYHPDERLPVGIHADEKRLRQVLINLLGNAIKFTDRGEVNFKVEVVTVNDLAEQIVNNQPSTLYKIRFQVEDTGIGMTPEQLTKIFLPFEQVGDFKRQAEGSGLGLAISQQIVHLMGSALNVESHFGQGSVFWFEVELPEAKGWATASQTMPEGTITGYQGGEKCKILVVDDHWENRSVIVNLLEPIGFEVIEATNGQEGIEKAIAIQPDVIITDLVMPIMNGFALIEQVKQSELLENVVIIASSASVFEADQNKSLDAGANAFLPKPIATDTLLELLGFCLDLTWIYAPKTEMVAELKISQAQLNSDKIDLPPLEVLNRFYELVKDGDIDELLHETSNLKQSDPRFVPFAQQVIQLAENFQLKKLKDTFSEWLNQSH